MKSHPESATLQLHLDGELPVEERWRIEAHLRECEACAEEYAALRHLVADVAALPASIEPPTDLWAGIAARIEAEARVRSIPARRASRRPGTITVLSWASAAAAVLLIGIGIGRVMPRADLPVAVSPVPVSNGAVILASYDQSGYDQAIADLQLILEGMRDRLRPETVAALEENLAIIDRAIAESRAALLADPANAQLHRHLATTMQTKVDLLRMVTGAVTVEI